MSEQPLRLELLSLTADIVSAHTSNNTVGMGDLPNIIQQIFVTLSNLSTDGIQGEVGS